MELAPNTVHLWSISTVASDAVVSTLERNLSPDEVARSRRFRFPHLTQRFVITRGTLRMLIGRYLDILPEALEFVYNVNGKPGLASGVIDFNLSHSGDLVLFAITKGCELGVDLEQIRALPDLAGIASRVFRPSELAQLARLDEGQRLHAFFSGWTRKEAYIKALGIGLSVDVSNFSVTVEPGVPVRLLELPNHLPACTLCDLNVSPGYAAALAYSGAERVVSQYPLCDPADLVGLVT